MLSAGSALSLWWRWGANRQDGNMRSEKAGLVDLSQEHLIHAELSAREVFAERQIDAPLTRSPLWTRRMD